MPELSPMMKQYLNIKNQHKDEIVFFRLGDFYEMFFDDAILVSKELELTLTGRDCGLEERAPMCGVPHHSCEAYIAKLIQKGYKIAICEQTEDPALAKGIVNREVIRVITPGTVTDSSMLDETKNNYICSLYIENKNAGICFSDISTGEVFVTELSGSDVESKIINEIARFNPAEIITVSAIKKYKSLVLYIKNKLISLLDICDDDFASNEGKEIALSLIAEHENTSELKQKEMFINCIGGLISYLGRIHKISLDRITKLNFYNDTQFMNLSVNTRKNLELTETMRSKDKRGSLLWVLDKTKTAMGKRLLRKYIEQPLLNPIHIGQRLEAVSELFHNNMLRSELIDALSGIYDIERLMTRIVYGTSNGRELKSLSQTALKLPIIKDLIANCNSKLLNDVNLRLDTLDDLRELIDGAIVDDPPVTIKEGGLIKQGYSTEVDELNDIINHSKEYLAKIELEEKDKTGIKNLKIGYNKVFGYYLEVTRSYSNLVPDHYIRKQTLSNCERYITEELKTLEAKIMSANEKIKVLEFEIFDFVRKRIAEDLFRIQGTASAIAMLDVFVSFADVSAKNDYCCPEVNLSDVIDIKEGRHPVVEQLIDTPFVSNDVYLNCSENQIAIITGPNMAGKSTYMRQTAILVLMAQIGCFIPAKSATIGVVDNIFTRVGASDDLSAGQSTFMVEMSEVAEILKNATPKSLLILDEIGRGTSTFDGMSIAKSVIEYIASTKKVSAKTLFATHYHELTVLEEQLSSVKNYNIAVKKRGDDITFLRRIVRGGADDSYGIEVAKLAGIPQKVIDRAKEILLTIESNNPSVIEKVQNTEDDFQLSLTETVSNAVFVKLQNIDIETVTPIEALNILYELKKSM